jgi:high-affinity iron transporter
VPGERLASTQARERGRRLFLEHCALCHGVRADGHGVRREGLSSPPRDFTDPSVRRKTSPRRMFFAIREGVRGTAMPSWKALDEEQTWDVVAFLQSVAP